MEGGGVSTVERKAYELLYEHLRSAYEAFRLLSLAVDSYLSGKVDEVNEYANKVKNIETKANDLKRSIYEYLAKAAPGLLYREEWLRFLFDLDRMIDVSDGLAVRVAIAASKGWLPPENIATALRELIEVTLHICEKLKEVFHTFAFNAERALTLCRDIEVQEEGIDRLHRRLSSLILEAHMSIPLTLILRDIAERIENVSDLVVDAVEDLRVLSLRRIT